MIRQYPQGNLFYRNLNKKYPVITHGKGVYLFDKEGKRYLDAAGGALVASLGHGNAKVAQAVQQQLSQVAYVNGMQFTTEAVERLAERVARYAKPLQLDRCAFFSSGSEAVEAALKLARQICVSRGQKDRWKIIARQPGYHGSTLGALAVSARPAYRDPLVQWLPEAHFVSTPQRYRFDQGDYEKDGPKHFAQELENLIAREGAESVCAFILEPVSGSSAGGAVPPRQYLSAIEKVCRDNGVIIIADEVLCGSGRTGKFFASEHFKFTPDIAVLGKGLGGGYVPISAIVTRTAYIDEMKRSQQSFLHAQTFMQVPSACAAANAVLDIFEQDAVLKHVTQMGEIFHNEIRQKILPLASIGNTDGMGLLAGIEWVSDKSKKRPAERKKGIAEAMALHAFDLGLTLWSNAGHVDGKNGDLWLLGPPLIIQENEIKEMIDTLARAITTFPAH